MDAEDKAAELLRKTLEEVEKYELPEFLREEFRGESPRTTASLVDGSLLQKYEEARDQYLKHDIEQEFAHQVATFDGEAFEMPALPNLEQQEAQREAARQAVRNMQAKAEEVQHKMDEVQAAKWRLDQRKEHMRRLLESFQENHGERFCNGILEQEDEVEEFVSEEDLLKEEERIIELKRRKKELLSKLHRIQEETLKIELETEQEQANAGILFTDDKIIAEIEGENEKLVQEIKSHKENASWATLLMENVETLGGFKVMNVDTAPGKVVVGVDDNNRDVLRDYEVKCQFALLDDTHEANHELAVYFNHVRRPFMENDIKIVHAELLADEPRVTAQAATSDGKLKTMRFSIRVDDLVPFANTQRKKLSFIVNETMCRITKTQERAEALCRLAANKPFHLDIGQAQIVQNNAYDPRVDYDENYGRYDIEVPISISEHDVQVVVCLLGDGSPYVTNISGKESGTPTLEEIKTKSNDRFKTKNSIENVLRDVKKMLDSRK